MAKFYGGGTKLLTYIQELDINFDILIGYNLSLFRKVFNKQNIFFLVIREHESKGESTYTIIHVDINYLKKWANNKITLFDAAVVTKGLFSLYVKNEKETIRRIQHKDIGPADIWNGYDGNSNVAQFRKVELLKILRNIELDELLKD